VFETPANKSGGSFSLDYRRIVHRVVRFWYMVALSLLFGVIIAYLANRYTTRIYPIMCSILIRESEENADAKFLYNNSLVSPYRNYFNELYIIRSYPLMTKVVEELNFNVKIQKEGDIKVTEQYNAVPFLIKVLDKKNATRIKLQYIGNNTFKCSGKGVDDDTQFAANESVNCQGVSFSILPTGNLETIKNQKFQVNFYDAEDVAGNYINRLKISWAESGSSVVNLSINGEIPQKEIDFLNRLIERYQKYDLDKKSLAALHSLEFIDGQLAKIGDTLRMFENALENFKKKNFVTDLSIESQQLYDQVKEISNQKTLLIYGENYYKYVEEYLKKNNAYDQVLLPSNIGITDEVLSNLVTNLINAQTELNAVSLAATKPNPMVNEKAQLLKSTISDIKNQIFEAISSQRATDKIRITGFEKQIAVLEGKLRSLPAAERTLVNIQRNYSLNEALYTFLQQKRAEAGISKASTTSDIIVVNPPRIAGGAITPQVTQNYAIGVGSGLFVPILIFVLIELLNTRVQSKDDIEKITGIPFIGSIGHNNSNSSLVVVSRPKSALAESFRALRSNLNYFTEGKDKKIFMVTSSLSGEGKSFTTINLATVFSLAGKKTLIIGADLRRPKIFDDFGLNNEKGLSVYLSGLVKLEEIIQPTNIENLHVISGGPVPPNPSELLLNSRMDALINELKDVYDFILMDTPPLALITDGLVLSKYADHTVYIVRQNYTPRSVLQAATEIYVSGKIQNLSIVLNDVLRSGPGYGYGYAYDYGYGYGARRKKRSSNYYDEDN
jgi:capsular exopolysaccharide synthesis family protein